MNLAQIVIDPAFGDGGKGLLVDNLCQQSIEKNGRTPLVVRFSGGQQAGHTVMDGDKQKHTFSSFGSGSFLDCETFFTEDTTFYLTALMNERNLLAMKGCVPKLTLHPHSMMTTPYDVAYNRVKEEMISKHGSCGMGVGATMKRCLETPHKTFAIDLKYPKMLMERLESVKRYYLRLMEYEEPMTSAFVDHVNQLMPHFMFSLKYVQNNFVFFVNDYDNTGRDIIFEGSQGVMLDMDHGVFPNVTYANTTSKNAFKYVRKWNLYPELYYVTRCYTTRHGAGWMPNDNAVELINTEEEINVDNRWQGGFRIGEFSYEMIRHGIDIDTTYHENTEFTNKTLVVTCLDQRPDFILDKKPFADLTHRIYGNNSPKRGHLTSI